MRKWFIVEIGHFYIGEKGENNKKKPNFCMKKYPKK
jgi:hypothetical protein